MGASLAMLLQSQLDPAFTAETLLAQMHSDWPDLDPSLLRLGDARAEAGTAADADDDDSPMQCLEYGDYLIALMPIPVQIGGDIDQICAHSRLWPEATPAPVDYAAHTIVTVMRFSDDGQDTDLVAQAALLSRVLASAVAVSGSIQAVYLGSANHVVLPALFRELAQASLPGPMPIAWVAINVGARPDGVMTGHTRGMDMLGLMDIEIPETADGAQEVFSRLTGIVDYLIENGMVIADGDTLGATAEERIRVVYGRSALDPERQVMRLQTEEFPQARSGRSWWSRLLN
ncbi:DUF4261 domain-containing protein [Stenotrophomonas sp. UBA7606]|uniref:DUF4261 domain-containing protein n=1 Tax=Stenotrophomonas sp. UBA7606 TaxID=1947559 RepID=UPI0025FB1AAC|nr:DUF4261 domain-containing protein [Stenotrophomonas sp. UBA7606]